MSRIFTSLSQLIGATPLVELRRLEQAENLSARLLVKLECRNPAGSAKDRIALSMLEAAEHTGLLKPGGTVIEPTSGNTGIALAALAAARGYGCIIVMPDSMSAERQKLIRAYGARLVLTPGGMSAAIAEAQALARTVPNSILAGQFVDPANPEAHYRTTGPEIWADTDGRVDVFIAGIGTGGTVTGAGRYLKERDPTIQIIGVEPADSPLLTRGRSGPHSLQGIGPDFIPATLDTGILDQVIPVTGEEAVTAARRLARTEGILPGISGGAALHAALLTAHRPENTGKTVVALLPDSGERYLSTDLYPAPQ